LDGRSSAQRNLPRWPRVGCRNVDGQSLAGYCELESSYGSESTAARADIREAATKVGQVDAIASP